MLLLGCGRTGTGGPDTTDPEIQSATVEANGVRVTLIFTEPVFGADGEDFFSLTGETLPQTNLVYVSGDGTATVLYDLADGAVEPDEDCTLDFVGEPNVDDAADNVLADFADFPVTNNTAAGDGVLFGARVFGARVFGRRIYG